ncbi:hypothetical protein FA15DRAFT_710848 [Coprinopsis marcescibilis]|uniref:Uncharacterized protein n=1 Tax=Coprinopsis marcescibilis TaxID=230819 RepID=A0A5C3KC15_COPMA|nr:hypothetical protein FA15DRAFT_710848 [Coprinopsis marcescibilis]
MSGDEAETAAQARAVERTTGGDLKTAQIAGALLNHKDDKKGHHDLFHWWWDKNVGINFTYPDTSNTWFGFMVKSKKGAKSFNHMEQNFWNALHYKATLTELVALALYSQSFSHPYMHSICAEASHKTNMLDLGPLHHKFHDFILYVISQPLLVLNSTDYTTATADGQPWQSEETINKIQELAPTLPNLKALFLAGLQGTEETWSHFISEFAPGGLIDEATQEEHDLAWLAPTNDVNEGALGSFCLMMQRQPQLSLLGYNSQRMYFHNETAEFMQKFFVELEDHLFLHKAAQEAMGEDKKRKAAIIQFQEQKNAEQQE